MALVSPARQALAEGIQEMMQKMPLEKVRVDQLCREAGVDRRTFYNHFKDKYDLVAWIFMQDYQASLTETQGHYTLEHVEGTLRRLKEKEVFYRKAFSDKSQNTISFYLYEYFVRLGQEVVRAYAGGRELLPEEVYAIKSYSFACVGHTAEWLEGKSGYTPEEFASLQYGSMPEILRKAYGIEERKAPGKTPGEKKPGK